jgi:ParB family chromosome partitioning protein
MKSANDLMSRIGGNMRESMGAHREGGSLPAASSSPAFHGETAKYRGALRVRDAFSIEVDRLMADPNQPRTEFDHGPLAELAASLKDRGQLQPIRVRYSAEADKWVIVAGERRYRAAVLASIPSLMAIEAKGQDDPDNILEDQLVENCVREDLKPIEQARAFKMLLERKGWTYRQLSDRLNVAPASVARALKLLELPDDLQGRVESGAIAPSVAYEVARLDGADAQRQVADRIAAEGMNRAEATEAVRRSAAKSEGSKGRGRGAAPKVRKPTTRMFRLPEGKVTITVELRKGVGDEAIEALITAALEAMRGQGQEAA